MEFTMRTITTLLAAAAIIGIGLSAVPAEARDWNNSSGGHYWNNNTRHHSWNHPQQQRHWYRPYLYSPRAYHRAPGPIFGFNFR
jgi:hypothetical protein